MYVQITEQLHIDFFMLKKVQKCFKPYISYFHSKYEKILSTFHLVSFMHTK